VWCIFTFRANKRSVRFLPCRDNKHQSCPAATSQIFMPTEPEWAYRTVHPRAEPNRTVHFRAESPPRSKFSSASRTESGVSMLALDNVRFENIRAEPNRLLECSVRYGSARGCTVKKPCNFMLVKPSECQYDVSFDSEEGDTVL
jgi:hypothetical protein